MRWSWRVGRIAGIDLRVHATFLFLLVWAALAGYQVTHTASGAARGVVFILALFLSVVLHELGHALTARRFGVPTRDITLLPIGGVARLAHIPREPRQELRVALAGPAVTLAIIVVLYAVQAVLGFPPLGSTQDAVAGRGTLLSQLMWANVTLLVFNLLPAFPMDGGRVLRASLALRMPYGRATALAARVGQGFALVFGIIGLFYNPWLVIIALFVWLGAVAEAGEVQQRSALEGVPVERLMIRDVRTLDPKQPLQAALEQVLAGFQQDFPVVENGRLVGMLTRARLLDGLARRGSAAPVGEVMETAIRSAKVGEPAERALAELRECRCQSLPIMEDGRLVGVLTLENVGEYVMIEAALRARAAPSRPASRPDHQ
ncbi:MAG TPA: site-2 protease family protein [Gemmatimonadales bacterium]|nr:site-2 protease family protein [Gemmatimonadales bacterium]